MSNKVIWKVTEEQLNKAIKSTLTYIDKLAGNSITELKLVTTIRETFGSWYTKDDYVNRIESIQTVSQYLQLVLPIIITQNIQATLLPLCEQEIDDNFTLNIAIPKKFYFPYGKFVMERLTRELDIDVSFNVTESDIELSFEILKPYSKYTWYNKKCIDCTHRDCRHCK